MVRSWLPPLTEVDLDVILLGLCHARLGTDAGMGEAADALLARIEARLPPMPPELPPPSGAVPPDLATALRQGRKLRLRYRDRKDRGSDRLVWPVELSGGGASDMLLAWCEARSDFRHFRLDRIEAATAEAAPVPKHRRILLAEMRALAEAQGH